MELRELYELHDRLEAAAVAGVNLMEEDFRLKRAIEAVKPLSQASPVIGKLYRMALGVISPECEDRAGSLLDVLALSQALLCTQASFGAGGEEEITALAPAHREYCPCLPYSRVKPLEEALTCPGGGRYALIMEAINERPEDLKDYRLSAAMVTALSDSYRDIAVTAARYLAKQDKGLLPLIKEGFEEASEYGKLGRLRAMEGTGGKDENDFYVSLLDHAKKELREEAIRALRMDPGNTERLLDLANTEKGACLEAVKQSLSAMGTEPARQYLEEQFTKDPQGNAGYIRLLRDDSISDRLAGEIEVFLNEYDKAQGEMPAKWNDQFDQLFLSMAGKGSCAMQDVYRRAARSGSPDRPQYLRFPDMLITSILQSGDERLVDLAGELAKTAGKWWNAPAFAADLLILPAKEVYDRYRKAIPKDGFLGLGREEKQRIRKAMMGVFGRIHYNDKTGRQECSQRMEEYGAEGRTFRSRRPLVEPLDPRWYELLMDDMPGDETVSAIDENGRQDMMTYDQILYRLLPPERRPAMGDYFHRRALDMKDNRSLYGLLIRCGWKDYRGLVSLYVKKNPEAGLSIWEINRMLAGIPLTEEERQMEIREIDRILCGYPKHSPARKNWDAYEQQRRMINEASGLPGGK